MNLIKILAVFSLLVCSLGLEKRTVNHENLEHNFKEIWEYGCSDDYCWGRCDPEAYYYWCWTGHDSSNYVKCTSKSDCSSLKSCVGRCSVL